jgi:hypothetical protein
VESKLGPLGTSATEWPIVPAPGDYDDGEFGGMNIGKGNQSTRRKPAPAPVCPPQIPLDQTRVWTRAPAVGSQRLTAWTMARPHFDSKYESNTGYGWSVRMKYLKHKETGSFLQTSCSCQWNNHGVLVLDQAYVISPGLYQTEDADNVIYIKLKLPLFLTK